MRDRRNDTRTYTIDVNVRELPLSLFLLFFSFLIFFPYYSQGIISSNRCFLLFDNCVYGQGIKTHRRISQKIYCNIRLSKRHAKLQQAKWERRERKKVKSRQGSRNALDLLNENECIAAPLLSRTINFHPKQSSHSHTTHERARTYMYSLLIHLNAFVYGIVCRRSGKQNSQVVSVMIRHAKTIAYAIRIRHNSSSNNNNNNKTMSSLCCIVYVRYCCWVLHNTGYGIEYRKSIGKKICWWDI